ncbi:MAG: GGDEF domain-containing protein, partial [Armatimonadetes bacterium]|nr:GGDEF domain-containing protein [Armatimonadota bacterium]
VRPDDESSSALVQIGQAAAEMAAVCEVAHALSEQNTLEDILSVVVGRALALVPADTVALYLDEGEGKSLRAVRVDGKYAERLAGMTIQYGEGVSGLVAQNQAAQVNVSAALDVARRFNPTDNQELSAATSVPLVHGPEILGVLTIYTTAYNILSSHHLHVLNILAEHAASAIQNIRRLEQHRDLAFTDPLTGLANSRCLFRQLERLLHPNRSLGTEGVVTEFSLVMLDLDGFKDVNDRLGHLRGDELLRVVAERLLQLGRADDLVCRYAGDEFVLLLPRLNEDQAERVAARVRSTIDAIGMVDGKVPIGASVGIATFPQDGSESRELIHIADTRMYEDKFHRRQSGKSRGRTSSSSEAAVLVRS